MYLNKTEHMGGLTREPELRFLPSGVAVCEFSLAIGRVRWNPEARRDELVVLAGMIDRPSTGTNGYDEPAGPAAKTF